MRDIFTIKAIVTKGRVVGIRLSIGGGELGAHVASCSLDKDGKSWNDQCDCIGFGRHQKCRHVKSAKRLAFNMGDLIHGENRRLNE